MKIFFFKGTLFVVGGILIAQALTLVVTTLQFDLVTDYRLQVNQFLQQSSEIELVTLGNSHNLAIDLDEFNQKGYHLWRPGGDFAEAEYLADHLLEHSQNVQTVLIPTSYISFHAYKKSFERHKIDRRAMYSVIPSGDFIRGDFNEFMIGKAQVLFPLDSLLQEDHWALVIQSIFDKSLRTANTKRGADGQELIKQYRECKYREFDNLVTYTKKVGIPTHVQMQNTSLQNKPNLPTEAYATIVRIIQKLQTEEIRVIFYTPPYFEIYNDLSDKETIVTMKGYMAQLQQDYGVEYYDFSEDPTFVHNNRLFFDDDHLNKCGAKIFSAKLNELLLDNAPEIDKNYAN